MIEIALMNKKIIYYHHLQSIYFTKIDSTTLMIFNQLFSKVSHFKLSPLSLQTQSIMFFSSFSCNNCSKKTSLPQCTACHRMVNYFNIFNIPEEYKVNQQAISSKAKQLQKQYHPDKHQFDENMQNFFKENMSKYSAYINQAKSTLLDDLKRAIYMMELRGIDIEESKQIQDNKFMAQMFSLQQEIEEASRDGCDEIKNRIEEIMMNLQIQFDQFFKSEDMAKCKEFVFKYKYLNSALQNVNRKLNAIQVGENN